MTRKQLIALVATAAVLTVAVAAAWALEWLGNRSGSPKYSIAVVRSGQELAKFDVAKLKALPQKKIVADGKSETGPTLLGVLSAAGVHDFSSVTVRGMGVRDSGVIELSRAEVNSSVLLDFAERGTMKLVSPGLEWEDRVRDVTRIEVQ